MSFLDNCPKCNTSFIGDPIPDDIIENYAGTHWRREIGIDGGMMGIYDGVVAWECPDCKHQFPVSDHPIHQEMFQKYTELCEKS
jgi:hypothetical protein